MVGKQWRPRGEVLSLGASSSAIAVSQEISTPCKISALERIAFQSCIGTSPVSVVYGYRHCNRQSTAKVSGLCFREIKDSQACDGAPRCSIRAPPCSRFLRCLAASALRLGTSVRASTRLYYCICHKTMHS
jgi:hypothetical protein